MKLLVILLVPLTCFCQQQPGQSFVYSNSGFTWSTLYISKVDSFATCSTFKTNTVVVTDSVRGGTFVKYSGNMAVDNGMIFSDATGGKWLRQLSSDYLDIRWFGAKSDGSDTRDAFIAAINSAKANMASVKNIVDAYTSTATAAGTTTLTASSTFYQNFSGTSTQTVTLPDATTLTNGHQFFIMDNSTGNLTVNMNGGSLLRTVPAGQYIIATLTSNGTSAGTWTVQASIPQTEFIRQSATYTLSSTTNIQKLFNASTNGALTVKASTTYNFEGVINISSMSGTSGNMKFDILGAGTATLTSAGWCAVGLDATTPGTAAATGGSFTATNVSSGNIVTAATGTAVFAYVKGTFTVNAGGTIIPSIGLTTATAAVVGVNTWMTVTEILPGGTNYTSGWN